jgi:signal transduction histidine kinase
MPRLEHSRSGHFVLVVDDEEEAITSFRPLLEREGHVVHSAHSGKRALEVLREHDIHLAVVDFQMPGMNGAELVRAIRCFDPYIQIIVQTGYAGRAPQQLLLQELDIQGYHDKGDGPEKLLAWVAVGLRSYRFIRTLRERERAYTELVANVSHELRTPMNIINGYAQLLLDGTFGALGLDALQPVRSIEKAVRNLSDLINDFLQFAKAESGVVDLSPTLVDPRELAQELERLGTLLLDQTGVAFSVVLEAEDHDVVADPVKLRTILRNLVTNAAKFTSKGTVRVHMSCNREGLIVSVADTGPGIRESDLGMIFEPFRQVDGSPTRAHGGIGLGLALSRKYARLLRGEISVVSVPGGGSTFTLTIPGRSAPPASAALAPGAAPRAAAAA